MVDTIAEHDATTQSDDYALYAKLDSAKVLFNLVKSVNFKEVNRNETWKFSAFFFWTFFLKTGLICVLESGLKISCEDSKCTQGIAFVHSGLFQEYKVKEDCVCIRISLSVLLVSWLNSSKSPFRFRVNLFSRFPKECLNLFGSSLSGSVSTALKISYAGYGYPLTLLWVHSLHLLQSVV